MPDRSTAAIPRPAVQLYVCECVPVKRGEMEKTWLLRHTRDCDEGMRGLRDPFVSDGGCAVGSGEGYTFVEYYVLYYMVW